MTRNQDQLQLSDQDRRRAEECLRAEPTSLNRSVFYLPIVGYWLLAIIIAAHPYPLLALEMMGPPLVLVALAVTRKRRGALRVRQRSIVPISLATDHVGDLREPAADAFVGRDAGGPELGEAERLGAPPPATAEVALRRDTAHKETIMMDAFRADDYLEEEPRFHCLFELELSLSDLHLILDKQDRTFLLKCENDEGVSVRLTLTAGELLKAAIELLRAVSGRYRSTARW